MLSSKSHRLTAQMRQAIKKIPKGGNITFTNIKVKGPNGKESFLESGILLKLN